MLAFDAPLDPREVKDYAVDWSAVLGGDTIQSSSWLVASASAAAGLAVTNTSISGTVTTMWVYVASDKQSNIPTGQHEVVNTVVTVAGRTFRRTMLLMVRPL